MTTEESTSTGIMPPSNDTVPAITPEISRFPNPVPTAYQGFIAGLAPRDQTEQEKLSQRIAEELDRPIPVAMLLPVFNR
jgi:hypothetical protein